MTQAELGAMVSTHMDRKTPFTAAAVSRWETGTKVPGPPVIEAIALVTRTDPGWISHGSRSAAPAPAGLSSEGWVIDTPKPHPAYRPTPADGTKLLS